MFYLSIPSSLVRLKALFLAAACWEEFWPGEGGTLGVEGAGTVKPPETAVVPTVGLNGGALPQNELFDAELTSGLAGSSSPLCDGDPEGEGGWVVDCLRWKGARPNWAGVGASTNFGNSGGGIKPGGSAGWVVGAHPGVLGVLGVLLCLDTLLLLLLWLLVLGLGTGWAYSISLATGIVAVTALIRAGLERSLRVTGVSVPHNVPDLMFMTPAKHWADDDDDEEEDTGNIVSREGGRIGVPFEMLPAGSETNEWFDTTGPLLLVAIDDVFLVTITEGFNDPDHDDEVAVLVTWLCAKADETYVCSCCCCCCWEPVDDGRTNKACGG